MPTHSDLPPLDEYKPIPAPRKAWWDQWLLTPFLFVVVIFGTGLGFFIIANPAVIVIFPVLALACVGLHRLVDIYFEGQRPATPEDLRRALHGRDEHHPRSERQP